MNILYHYWSHFHAVILRLIYSDALLVKIDYLIFMFLQPGVNICRVPKRF
ncbi:MAG: hypothetical protein KatS3mg101_0529 [Patescibacteria group bacterium]|nr:MAG: hypothetical protein KatS3mg101_0529 [Patescibacteria group bacterium]